MNLLEFIRVLKNEDIARRYFVMNSFDGTLTVLGVIVAMFLAGVRSSQLIIVSCLGVAVSLLVSGIWSAYAAEKAERQRRLKELERHLMKDLDETKIDKKFSQLSILLDIFYAYSKTLPGTDIIEYLFPAIAHHQYNFTNAVVRQRFNNILEYRLASHG